MDQNPYLVDPLGSSPNMEVGGSELMPMNQAQLQDPALLYSHPAGLSPPTFDQ